MYVTSSRYRVYRRTRQDYDRADLRPPPVEKLWYKCRSFGYAAPVVWNRLPRSTKESDLKLLLRHLKLG